MRPVPRLPLSTAAAQFLDQRQINADQLAAGNELDTTAEWKSARQHRGMQPVLQTLERMAGERKRCMYCLDSSGTDIEHFWPKKRYPERMFRWPNLLVCCTECGRFKRDKFPLHDDRPLLVDPTTDNPWEYLEFVPETGVLTARYQRAEGRPSPRGEATVEVLQLDRREALGAGYKRTWKRIAGEVQEYLRGGTGGDSLPRRLLDLDDHGLLGWCFDGNGGKEKPLRQLRTGHPEVWAACEQAYREANPNPAG